jgi:hypothetical protein
VTALHVQLAAFDTMIDAALALPIVMMAVTPVVI